MASQPNTYHRLNTIGHKKKKDKMFKAVLFLIILQVKVVTLLNRKKETKIALGREREKERGESEAKGLVK